MRFGHEMRGRLGAWLLTMLLATLACFGFASAAVPGYQTQNIEGWTVHIDDRLLTADKGSTDRALVLLRAQLKEIVRLVPASPAAQLRKVTLWFSPPYPGLEPKGDYHPSAAWLRSHGRNHAMAKGIEFTNIPFFEKEIQRMPMVVLHELAHAYHDQVLGFENAELIDAYPTTPVLRARPGAGARRRSMPTICCRSLSPPRRWISWLPMCNACKID